MNLHVTVVLSGEDVTRRMAVEVEDAIAKVVQQLTGAAAPNVAYPTHRNGAMGFVLTVGEPPAKTPRIAKDKPQPDPRKPIDNPNIPVPETT